MQRFLRQIPWRPRLTKGTAEWAVMATCVVTDARNPAVMEVAASLPTGRRQPIYIQDRCAQPLRDDGIWPGVRYIPVQKGVTASNLAPRIAGFPLAMSGDANGRVSNPAAIFRREMRGEAKQYFLCPSTLWQAKRNGYQ